VQVDPMKPKLKPPGAKRLKLKFVILLSTSAFKFNLRRYHEDEAEDLLEMMSEEVRDRRFASFVRLEVQDTMPPHIVKQLVEELDGLSFDDVYMSPHAAPLGRDLHSATFQLNVSAVCGTRGV